MPTKERAKKAVAARPAKAKKAAAPRVAIPARPASVEEYLAAVPPKDRAALQRLRRTIRAVAPDATEVVSYAMPAFRVPGGVIAWYAWFPHHLSLFIRPNVTDKVAAAKPYRGTKSALHFSAEKPLPARLVAKLVKLSVADRAPAGRKASGKRPRAKAKA